jgi:hypothetical protein
MAAVGAGTAIGATQLTPAAESKAVVEDAAEQLGVDPTKLSDALKRALEHRIDEAVEAGTLTEQQGTAMKQRLESDDFPLFGGPAFGHPHRGFGHHGFADLSAAAGFLGLTQAALREELHDGNTLADVAKAQGKSVDGLVDALVAAATDKLDGAVAAGRLTKAQRDEIVGGLEQRTTDAVNGVRPRLREAGRAFGFRGPGFGLHGPGFGRHEDAEAPPPAA